MPPRRSSETSSNVEPRGSRRDGHENGHGNVSLALLQRICSHNPLLTELLLQALTPNEQAQLAALLKAMDNPRQAALSDRFRHVDATASFAMNEAIDALGELPDPEDVIRPTVLAHPDQQIPGEASVSGASHDAYVAYVLRLLISREGENSERFRIGEEIGRGGMGIIYRAWDQQLGRTVAVKAMHKEHVGSSIFVRRFITEGRIHGRLAHPGIAAVHAIGVLADDRPYIAMRCVEGETLASLLRQRRSSSENLPTLLRVFERVCDVIAYAHSRGVIHRDLKPENVIVGRFGLVKVMDWGLAKVIGQPEGPSEMMGEDLSGDGASGDGTFCESDLANDVERDLLDEAGTMYGTLMGTMAYAAPEQIRGDSNLVDFRADVFSLGAILCEILTLQPPYSDTKPSSLYRKACTADLTDALERLDRSGADGILIDVARRCLSVDPQHRFSEARHVAFIVTSAIESHLQRVERELVRFFDLSMDLCCIAGLDGYFRRLNVNFPKVLGYSEEELLAQPFLHFVHPDDQEATVNAMKDLERGQPVVRFRNRYRCADGRYLWLEWGSQPALDEGVVYAVARDVTSFMTEPH